MNQLLEHFMHSEKFDIQYVTALDKNERAIREYQFIVLLLKLLERITFTILLGKILTVLPTIL